MLGFFLYFKIAFNIGCDISPGKGLTLLNSGIFRFLTRFGKKVFKSVEYLESRVNILSPSTGIILSEDFV